MWHSLDLEECYQLSVMVTRSVVTQVSPAAARMMLVSPCINVNCEMLLSLKSQPGTRHLMLSGGSTLHRHYNSNLKHLGGEEAGENY